MKLDTCRRHTGAPLGAIWRPRLWIAVLGLTVLTAGLAACGPTPQPCPECSPCPACPTAASQACPTAEACPTSPVAADTESAVAAPFEEQWAGSPHADAAAAAFTHWNEDEPPVIPATCAKCHSESGFADFVGADGSEVRVVNSDQPIGQLVTCDACHSEAAIAWDRVVFPSGAEVSGLGAEARCMECHQGRASGPAVTAALAEAGVADEDTVSPDLGFTNIHYRAAAATLYGTLTKGGFEYDGQRYDGKFDHVAGFDTCIGCHDQHTLELKIDACAGCHPGVKSAQDVRSVRMTGSLVDYDGDGNMEEGIYYEVEGLQQMLYEAIQAYAKEVSQAPIIYDPDSYPYFFLDGNGNGQVDEGEATADNQYNAWTARLDKAAYNYQMSLKDPGSYAHGGKYMIQLLYDSVASLNEKLAEPIDLSKANRLDHGHFAGSEEAFRHWDEEGIVPGLCSRCHTAEGLPLYIKEGVNISEKPSNGLNCATCHDDLTTFTVYQVPWVRFPRGVLIDSGDPESNLCLNCHQGLSSIATVNGAIGGRDLDTVAEDLEFINIHYFAAAATLYGTEVQGAYEYATEAGYAGRLVHVEGYNTCTGCHDIHRQQVKAQECGACHQGVETQEDLAQIRMSATDYDGDGDVSEGIAGEIGTMRDALYAALQTYATDVASAPLVYDPDIYPYFFADSNANGQVDQGEAVFSNKYASWTPRLLRAAYNYQYVMKDPGTFAHNPKYVLQLLYDTLVDMAGDTSGMTRP